MSFLFYGLYNLPLWLVYPQLWACGMFNEKLAGTLDGQKDIQRRLQTFKAKHQHDKKPVVWLHAASAGEFEQIKPFITRLKKQPVLIFQTLTSPTIFYKVSHDPMFDGVCFLPFDLKSRVDWFIKTLEPAVFINTRHDIWPNLLRALRRHQVRNILVNANLYANSKRLWPGLKQINRSIFSNIDKLYTGSKSLQALLSQLYSGPMEVSGDSRFDQVHERALANDSVLIPEQIISDRRVIVYGSAIPSDLEIITQCIEKTQDNKSLLHIIVPHEVGEKDVIPWEIELFRRHIKSIRYTEIGTYKSEPVIIWNTVGQLADLYKHAQLAYVGAGFTTGVHSVTEPAIYHVPSAHGPRFDILAEAIELVDHGLSTLVQDSSDLHRFCEMTEAQLSEKASSLAAFMDSRIGATDRILAAEFHTLKLFNDLS